MQTWATRTTRRRSGLVVPASRAAVHPLLDLQQRAGNRATALLVQRQDASSDAPWTTPALLDGGGTSGGRGVRAEEIEGLSEGDGLTFGTWEKRPAVKALQRLLNERGGASLDVDGMWGAKTSAALQAAQRAAGLSPGTTVDAATASALTSGARDTTGGDGTTGTTGTTGGEGTTDTTGDDTGGSHALPDISGIVPASVMQAWLAGPDPYDRPIPLGELGSFTTPLGLRALDGASAAGELGEQDQVPMGDDQASWAIRFQYYAPVLHDMQHRNQMSLDHAVWFAKLVEVSAEMAASWAAKAFECVAGWLAGVILGPPGIALWDLCDRFLGLGRRVADETKQAIVHAAADPVCSAALAFNDVVWESYRRAYPMREPDMPWYQRGSEAITDPIVWLENAYNNVRELDPA